MQIPDRKVALSLGAHPDDAEFVCAGTLALLRREGWEIHIATMTPGDKGTTTETRTGISRVRRAEAGKAAEILDGRYHCLESEDVYIIYDRETINRATELLRKIRPAIVFTTSPSDYMVDHEIASRVTQTACFACGVKNMEVDAAPFEPVPWLYYADPIEAKDIFGSHVAPGMWVDISSVIDMKESMLLCHASQREWLMAHHRVDQYTNMMKEGAAKRGQEVQVPFAEGFRQHLGHCFPQENLLKIVLGDLVVEQSSAL